MGIILSRIRTTVEQKGLRYGLRSATNIILSFRKKSTEFKFRNKSYPYFYHWYNFTWANERAVEIPIFLDILNIHRNPKEKILEIGNVLSHYAPCNHDVVDKYERVEGITNKDVFKFRSPERYDLIISISTLEHLGWDESPKDPTKAVRALRHLKTLLRPKGKMVVSFPLGYNDCLDKLLKQNKLPFTQRFFLKRIFPDNRWEEVNIGEASRAKYDAPFVAANAIVIGIVQKS